MLYYCNNYNCVSLTYFLYKSKKEIFTEKLFFVIIHLLLQQLRFSFA